MRYRLLVKTAVIVLTLSPLQISLAQEMLPENPGGNLINNFIVSGFFDASYAYVNSTGENSFNFNEAEIDLEREFEKFGRMRLDLEYTDGQTVENDFELEQVYFALSLPALENASITFGKFNSPMGCEAMDPPDKIFYSYSMLCNYSLPSNLTGFSISGTLRQNFDIMAFVVNGWDQDSDNNNHKTYGGRLGYSWGEFLYAGVSAIQGSELESEDDLLTVLDMDWGVYPLSGLSLGGDLLYGKNRLLDDSLGSPAEADWIGYSIFTHVTVHDWLGFSGRYESLRDNDGYLFEGGEKEYRQAVSLGPVANLPHGVKCLMECRFDFADKPAYPADDGILRKNDFGIGFESVYSF